MTFDDVPAAGITASDLAILKANKVHADFFTNTMNYSGPEGYPITAQIITDGNYLGNHTMTHPHLGTLSSSAINSELLGVESVVNMLTSGSKPHLTRFRAPYGEPFQQLYGDFSQNVAPSTEKDTLVAPVVAKYAVEVDWNFDSCDSCSPALDPLTEIKANFKTPGTGNTYGIILMHGVLQITNSALQGIIDYFKANGWKLATVEDYICWEYGMHSWDIVNKMNPGAGRQAN